MSGTPRGGEGKEKGEVQHQAALGSTCQGLDQDSRMLDIHSTTNKQNNLLPFVSASTKSPGGRAQAWGNPGKIPTREWMFVELCCKHSSRES